jgi:hypothetical protein
VGDVPPFDINAWPAVPTVAGTGITPFVAGTVMTKVFAESVDSKVVVPPDTALKTKRLIAYPLCA